MRITRAHVTEISIYTALTCIGLIVDLGVANLLVYIFSLPLVVAGLAGLIAGTITNYFVHLKLTFKDRNLSASWFGFWKYLQTCLLGAAIRLIALAFFSLFPNISPYIALFIATTLSFVINYVLSRFYVFKSPS